MEPEERRKGPNVFVSLGALILGPMLVYYALQQVGWHRGMDLNVLWTRLTIGLRAVTMAGFMAGAYGVGGLLNAVFGRRAEE